MSKRVLVPIADGIEEIEAVCIIDTLRRADLDVTLASVGQRQITASRGIVIQADTIITTSAQQSYDLIALPGGMPGAANLAQCEILINLLRQQKKSGKWLTAICAAPAVVLQAHGLLDGIKATCYPSFQDRLDPNMLCTETVVVDPPVITAQGPGVALTFALTLVEHVCGKEKRNKVASAMLAQ